MEKLLKYLKQFGNFRLNDIKFKNQGTKLAKKTLIIDLHPDNNGLKDINFMEFCNKRNIFVQINNGI